MLKFPPIKSKPLPKGIIYQFKADNHYTLADLKTGNFVGEMSLMKRPCDNLPFYNAPAGAPTLHVYSLRTYEQGKGWGDYLIDFAKGESYRQNCEGRCSLVAHHSGIAPHTFYKKKGFITLDESYNNYLDKCNKQGRRLFYEPAKDMFIPIAKFTGPKAKPKKEIEIPNLINTKTIFTKIKELIIAYSTLTLNLIRKNNGIKNFYLNNKNFF